MFLYFGELWAVSTETGEEGQELWIEIGPLQVGACSLAVQRPHPAGAIGIATTAIGSTWARPSPTPVTGRPPVRNLSTIAGKMPILSAVHHHHRQRRRTGKGGKILGRESSRARRDGGRDMLRLL